ncbi:zinc finger protein [Macleaya cordata]|uniref:Zinc finger protein n=1 Tax=Macleaya cordata TaxID=56857 RepID=A0A200QXK5_MACCD|nr:zinc finger protein [Macleaya cordata]
MDGEGTPGRRVHTRGRGRGQGRSVGGNRGRGRGRGQQGGASDRESESTNRTPTRSQSTTQDQIGSERGRPVLTGANQGPIAPAVTNPRPPVVNQRALSEKSWMEYYREFQGMKPIAFTGKEGPAEAHQWCKKMDKILEQFDCSEAYKQRMAVFQLEENAATWWDTQSRLVDPIQLTWTQFKELFVEHYFPFPARQAMAREFQELKQGDNQTVLEYENEFDQLLLFASHLIPTEQDKIDKFLNGLHSGIARHMIGQPSFDTYQKVVNCAKAHDYRIEEARKKKSAKTESKAVEKNEQKGGNGNGKDSWKHRRQNHQGQQNCKRQRTDGENNTNDQAVVQAQPQALRTDVTGQRPFRGYCHTCHEKGHKSAECPRRDRA